MVTDIQEVEPPRPHIIDRIMYDIRACGVTDKVQALLICQVIVKYLKGGEFQDYPDPPTIPE